MMSLDPLFPHTLLIESMQMLQFRFVVFSRKISIHSSAKGESSCKFCLFVARSAMPLLCRLRTSVTESDVSVMEFTVLAQILHLSALNVILW